MQGGLRLRAFAAAGGIAVWAVAVAALYVAAPHALGKQLAPLLPPERVAAVVEEARSAILAAGIFSLLAIVPLSVWIGGLLARPVALLRLLALRVARGEAPRAPALVVAELHSLAAALGLIAEEHHARLEPLERQRDDLAFLIDSVGEGIVQTTRDGRIVRINQTARAMLHLPAGVEGRSAASLIRNAELRRALEAAARGEVVAPFEVGLDDRRLLVVARPLDPTVHGKGGTVAVLVDFTELRRLEEVRRDFVANASHELKTPLTSIRGYSETLLTDDLPEELRRHFLETIHRNTDRLQRVVDDLLDLSRIESGSWRPELQELDLAELAREAWHGLAARAEPKEIGFAVDAAPGTAVLGDPFGIGQVFTNLFDNAIRYTPPEGRITVRIARAPGAGGGAERGAGAGWVVVEVHDTGTGIPRDALSRVFERFYRVDPARSRAEGGTGLGLAIVKHLVESMGGDVVAESELGRGTTMRFRLPAMQHSPHVSAS